MSPSLHKIPREESEKQYNLGNTSTREPGGLAQVYRSRGASKESSLLEKASQILNEDRQADYGDSVQNHVDIAQMWTVYLRASGILPGGTTISPKDVCQLMILLKVVRQGKHSKTDNLIDICGYADIQEQINGLYRGKSDSRASNKRDCCKGKDHKRAG